LGSGPVDAFDRDEFDRDRRSIGIGCKEQPPTLGQRLRLTVFLLILVAGRVLLRPRLFIFVPDFLFLPGRILLRAARLRGALSRGRFGMAGLVFRLRKSKHWCADYGCRGQGDQNASHVELLCGCALLWQREQQEVVPTWLNPVSQRICAFQLDA
jgi:hypothetical protein